MKKKYKLLLTTISLIATIFAIMLFIKSSFFIYNDYFLNKSVILSSAPLDVTYVYTPKYLETLPYYVTSIRKHPYIAYHAWLNN